MIPLACITEFQSVLAPTQYSTSQRRASESNLIAQDNMIGHLQ